MMNPNFYGSQQNNDITVTAQQQPSNQSSLDNIFSADKVDGKKCYPMDFIPRDTDVIVGKGINCYNHAGNKMLRRLVSANLIVYAETTCKKEKSKILSNIVDHIRIKGSFIKKDRARGQYFDADDFLARDKISQAFRNAINQKKRSKSSSAKVKGNSTKQIYREFSAAESLIPKENTTTTPAPADSSKDTLDAHTQNFLAMKHHQAVAENFAKIIGAFDSSIIEEATKSSIPL